MSFPGLFASSYQLYKQNTDRIARWLLEAAQQCGYQHLDSNASNPQHSGSMKHKSDTSSHTTKQPTANRSSQPKNKEIPVFRIGITDFTDLAIFIANNANSTVPPKIRNIIQQTIDLRRAYGRFYEEQVKEDIAIAAANSRSVVSGRVSCHLVGGPQFQHYFVHLHAA